MYVIIVGLQGRLELQLFYHLVAVSGSFWESCKEVNSMCYRRSRVRAEEEVKRK